jgi:hypothetical protein
VLEWLVDGGTGWFLEEVTVRTWHGSKARTKGKNLKD